MFVRPLLLRMRNSRNPQQTSRFFPAPNGSLVSTPTQRITRSSIAKFAYNAPADPEEEDLALGSDIEDAVTRSRSRKRRKITTGSETPNGIKKEEEITQTQTVAVVSSSKPSTPRRARKPARTTTDASTGGVKIEPPSDWEEMYNAALEMRQPGGAASNAAVDTMGCERLADRDASPRDQRFHTLVALMLSSQTKDTINAVVMKRLQTELPAHKKGAPVGLNLDNMLAVDHDTLNELIWAVGFHNNKTKYLKQTALILRDKFASDIPSTIEGLISLPGVGPKMAHLCLSAAWNRTEGIGVDVHVHRITNLWGWNKTKNPEETRLALQSWLPREKWREINWLLVGLGQTICLPVGRKCGQCELGLGGLCKAAERGKVVEGRKLRAKIQIEENVKDEEGSEEKVKLEAEEEIDQKIIKTEVKNEAVGSDKDTKVKV